MHEIFVITRRPTMVEDCLNFIDRLICVDATSTASDEFHLICRDVSIEKISSDVFEDVGTTT